ncbi:NADH-ubiquinone oxidoreductase 9.5 kDa subunit [Sarocladium strictum]
MSAAPHFWVTPLKYFKWASRERPALFWSCVIGFAGPAMLPTVPPIRRYFGDVDPAPIPVTYPVPNGPRKSLTGYDD